MNRYVFPRAKMPKSSGIFIPILLLSFVILLNSCTADNDGQKPNILFAISDDQGFPHTSAYGCKFVETPGFDRMAEEGVLFQNVYCAVPQCSPNRASILTGRYLWQNYEAGTHASLFPANLKVFTDDLIDAGYHVGSTGKPWAPGQIDKTNRLKNKNLIGKYYNAKNPEEYWKVFQKFLDERDIDQPFYFWYGTYDPHRPYDVGSGLEQGKRLEDVDIPPYLPDNDVVRSDFLDYGLRIERFDRSLVKMIEILEEMGELDNTLVIVTSDNGMPFPRAKGNAYDAGVRVPMAIRWGDKIPGGRENTELISHIDFAPTFLRAAGLPIYPEIEGKSFLDILINPDVKKREPFRESLFYGRERATSARPNNFGYPVRTIRTKKYQLVWNMKPDRSPTGDNFDEAMEARAVIDEIIKLKDSSAQYLKIYQDALGQRPEFELHDMEVDPSGLINLAYDPEHLVVFDRLFAALKEQLTDDGDPRLHGKGDIWESYPRFMGIRDFGGEHTAYRAVYNENYVQEGQSIPAYIFDSKHYKAFFEKSGISKEEYISILESKGVIIQKTYTWENLNKRPVPDWFEDAKFGIMIHWGPYSVIGHRKGNDYAEWAPYNMYRGGKETFDSYFDETFGAHPPEFGYKDVIPLFKAENWNPDEWADLFEEAGARYVTLTAEHHDGYALWDSDLTDWCATKIGPKRDLVGDLGKALKKKGIKYAPSYHRERHNSFFASEMYVVNSEPLPVIAKEIEQMPEAADLYGPFDLSDAFIEDYVARWKEIQDKYKPDFMWVDDVPIFYWTEQSKNHPQTQKFRDAFLNMVGDYFAASDEWGKEVYLNNKGKNLNWPDGPGCLEKDNLRMDTISSKKWENPATIGSSYGYARDEDEKEAYKSPTELIHLLCDVVSKNGNLLLNIGPRGDGTIPEGMQKRLLAIGEWLKVNGEAIYGTRPWVRFKEENVNLRFTSGQDALFAIMLEKPVKPVRLTLGDDLDINSVKDVSLLGMEDEIHWKRVGEDIEIIPPGDIKGEHAWVLKISKK